MSSVRFQSEKDLPRADRSMTVRDPVTGTRCRVIAGKPIPPNLQAAYERATGVVAAPKTST